MDSDKETPQTADNNDARQAADAFPTALPFDHRASANQNLSFEYAKPAFASAGLEWSDDNLVRLHLFDPEKQATNVALLLGDQCPYLVKCAVFEGDTKTNLTERQNVSGSVLNQIDATMMFLNQHNSENAWPEAALRESLVNAVLHRDYDKSGPILISIFDSSIEIVSPGGLVDGFEVNDLLNGVSESRNPWLAEVFEALHLSENYGTGVQRILDAYSQSLASPQLRVGPGSVAMILPKPVLDSAWPEPHITDENDEEPGNGTDNPDNDNPGEGSGKAKRYTFPLGGPHLFTTNPAEALVGSTVLAATPFSSVVFAGSKIWQLLNGNPDPKELAELPDSVKAQLQQWMVGRETNQLEIDALEQITKHLLSERKEAMSLREIQTELGTDSGELTNALEGLTEKGELKSVTCGETTKYSLPR
ncbi:Crp/Fnr family transcriptional regulator [Bifidobacterium sp. ESL0728]|uniref:ATP-binding protein n=1 Tax=Bifidobacterium sp. ESL0728 TaxID=2983220 RepID=UPI0023F89D57|nr:ATP-binding protein [Bifidobacterium sp. ESL0728]WEV58415.1 Crp/Fnr family transcriptional regulator [Bifidobacterium sp. ESL0728]